MLNSRQEAAIEAKLEEERRERIEAKKAASKPRPAPKRDNPAPPPAHD